MFLLMIGVPLNFMTIKEKFFFHSYEIFGILVFNTVLFLPNYEPNLILFRRFSKDDF